MSGPLRQHGLAGGRARLHSRAMGLTPPFVLLDDARPGGAARLYRDPVGIVRAETPADVPTALNGLRAARARGLHAAGYLTYDAGAGFEPRARAQKGTGPCLWFGLFENYESVAPAGLLPGPEGAWAGAPRPGIARAHYQQQFERVAELIAAGDIYQANLTFRASVPFAGSPPALYALLRDRAAAGYGGLIATGEQWLLSFSPELFFSLESGQLTARPMKGTALRDTDPASDRVAAEQLAADPKQRAENLMIVDLMRNDLARVGEAGSVAVPQLFHVERYPTVHQMVSTVTAKLNGELDALDALAALFPCGSITGAPKLRAMEIVAEVEDDARGVYTGAIGRLDANGDAMFNVAIRTLTLDGAEATLGLGSGVVADSSATEEWAECLAKGAFVSAGEVPFDLIETMKFDPVAGMPLLERHLARMKASAQLFGFEFDRHAARNELQAATFRLRVPARVRLLLAPSGAIAIGIAPLPETHEGPVIVAIRRHEVAPDDFRLVHKTSRRSCYPRDAHAFETLYLDSAGYLTEGSFTSIFVRREDGMLVTPPLRRGLLPGVLRAELLESGQAIEGDLTPADLEQGFYIGNALRGLVSAVTVADRVLAG